MQPPPLCVLRLLTDAGLQARYDAVFSEANFTSYHFRIRVKVENVNDEQRVKANVVGIKPIDYRQESRELIAAIKSYPQ